MEIDTRLIMDLLKIWCVFFIVAVFFSFPVFLILRLWKIFW